PIRVSGRALHMVDFPAGKMRAAYVPFFALAVRRQDKGALACPSQYSYFAHASLPSEICSTDLFWIRGFPTVLRALRRSIVDCSVGRGPEIRADIERD